LDTLQYGLADRDEGGQLSIEFGPAKEDRGWYFVEYSLPPAGCWFALLTVVVPGNADLRRVATAMEAEARDWLQRYPVAVFVSAFDAAGESLDLSAVRPCDHLMGLPGEGAEVQLVWRLIGDAEAPNRPFSDADLLRIYYGFPGTRVSSTKHDVEFQERMSAVRKGKLRMTLWLFAWVVAIPLVWAVFQWAGPRWLETAVLVYCVFKATSQALRLFGVVGPSQTQLREQEKQRKMDHYHYHCERNPKGFERLMLENLDQDARDSIAAEAAALRDVSSDGVQQAHRADAVR